MFILFCFVCFAVLFIVLLVCLFVCLFACLFVCVRTRENAYPFWDFVFWDCRDCPVVLLANNMRFILLLLFVVCVVCVVCVFVVCLSSVRSVAFWRHLSASCDFCYNKILPWVAPRVCWGCSEVGSC